MANQKPTEQKLSTQKMAEQVPTAERLIEQEVTEQEVTEQELTAEELAKQQLADKRRAAHKRKSARKIAGQRVAQRNQYSSVANRFLNSIHNGSAKFDRVSPNGYEYKMKKFSRSELSGPDDLAVSHNYSRWRAAAAARQLERSVEFDLRRMKRFDKLFHKRIGPGSSSNTLEDGLVVEETARTATSQENRQTSLTPPLNTSRTPLPSLPLNTSRTPLPSLPPNTSQCNWLRRRLYMNRPLSDHSGDFNQAKLSRELALTRKMMNRKKHVPPRTALKRARDFIDNHEKSASPRYFHGVLQTGINLEEEKLIESNAVDRQVIQRLKESRRLGRSIRSDPDFKYLQQMKTRLHASASQDKFTALHEKSSNKAIRSADSRRAYKISTWHRKRFRSFDKLMKEGGGELIDPRISHGLSAVPSYMAQDFKNDGYRVTGLSNSSVVGEGVNRKRSNFICDPCGEMSPLRIEAHVGGVSYQIYNCRRSAVTAVKSSMSNLVPSGA
ncbi:hypothetical protein NHQ30_000775 [Ciborinia camelliae]|nr:hypothetical protein NHQ30_000775 [Ciborinia camelliae]